MAKSSRIIDGLLTNTLYSFHVRAKNTMGVWSNLSTVVTHTTLKDTTTPTILSSITLLLLSGVFSLKWAKPSTLDLRGGGYKVYVYTSNTPASAILIREVGYTSDSTEIFVGEKSQDASITITVGTTYWWWVTTLDASGNESAKIATTPTSGSVSAAGTGLNHSVLTNLSYAVAGHTGFEPTVTKGNLTAGSTKITIGGTGTGALIGAGASVDVAEANITHNNIGGLTVGDSHTHYALLAGRTGGQTYIGGTGVTDILKLQGTSGNGTLTNPAIQLLVGNNGATVALTALNNGSVGIGTPAPDGQLSQGLVNGQQISYKSLTELTIIAAAATTVTTIQIPANVIVKAVSVRVTVVIPTAATFTVTGNTSATIFNTVAVAVAAGTTDKGNLTCPYNNGVSQAIRITPDATPANDSGRVRVTIWYEDSIPPTS